MVFSSKSHNFIFLVLLVKLLSGVASENVTEHFTSTQELLTWQPPSFIEKVFPYFLSGHDNEGCPVWVVDYSKWGIRSVLEKYGEKHFDDLNKYTAQMGERFVSPELFSLEGNPQENFVLIANLDGFSTHELTHRPTVQFFLMTARIAAETVQRKNYNVKRAYIVNSNFLFQTMWNLLKPVLGRVANFVDLYPSNPAKWKPVLLNHIPKDQLPEWLGGSKDFKPVKTFG